MALLETSASPRASASWIWAARAGGTRSCWPRRGFDLQAIDLSPAMVAPTRAGWRADPGRGGGRRGGSGAGRMRDLSRYADGRFDLVVALGVLHVAQDEAEWHEPSRRSRACWPRAASCSSRTSRRERARPGAPLARVLGTAFVHEGYGDGRMCLRRPADLDADFARLGLDPQVPTEVVEREEGDRRRVTVNALYRKAGGRRK